jgi:hypothetical protein
MSSTSPNTASQNEDGQPQYGLDFRDLYIRFCKGFYQIAGLGLLGLAIASAAFALFSPLQTVQTSTRVVFSFEGFERGLYPDGSKFQAEDLRAPAIIAEAMRRQGLDTSEDAQSKIRSAISIEGIIPDNIVKARDRLRATGQTPPPYLPDEYTVTLAVERNFPMTGIQRERLLVEIVNVARENFKRTYGQLPVAFGTAFATLQGADLPEYEIVFDSEVSNLTAYLQGQIEIAKTFRSPSTNLSFKDLLEQVSLFSQLDLNESLGLIRQNGLARDRKNALLKMDYYLRQLGYEEQHALEDEKVVRDLLAQAQTREQNYVLGVKSQAAARPGETPILDQGLVDSLVANDAYNFLVRQALQAGLKVKQLQSQKAQVSDIRDNLLSFEKGAQADQTTMMQQFQATLGNLQAAYNRLVANVRKTHSDFADQEYGNAIQMSAQVHSTSLYRSLAVAALVGAFLGCALGSGLSLLGIFLGRSTRGA